MTVVFAAALRYDEDALAVRDRVRRLAEDLGLDRQTRTKLVTAVSEHLRAALAGEGRATLSLEVVDGEGAQEVHVRIGPIDPLVVGGAGLRSVEAEGGRAHRTLVATAERLRGTARLVDRADVEVRPAGDGAVVTLVKRLAGERRIPGSELEELATAASEAAERSPFEEIRRQNDELVATLAELRAEQRAVEESHQAMAALYEELAVQAEALRAADSQRAEFLRTVAHEVRTPMYAAQGMVELLLDGISGELTAEQRADVGSIGSAVAEALRLVDEQLDLARIDSGTAAEPRPREVDVPELFATLRGMTRPLVRSPDVALQWECEDALPTLVTDPGMLGQVLRNLVGNALKFTDRGSVSVRATRDEDDVVFLVRDTGVGIPAEHLDRVFEEFAQVDAEQDGRPRGTGLGLPLVRRLAEALGGSVQLASTVGVGTTVTVRLPLALPAATRRTA